MQNRRIFLIISFYYFSLSQTINFRYHKIREIFVLLKKNIFLCNIQLARWGSGMLLRKKGVYQTLSSGFQTSHLWLYKKIRQRGNVHVMVYPNICIWQVFCIFLSAWAGCVVYPCRKAMRRPEIRDGRKYRLPCLFLLVYCRIRGDYRYNN